MSDYTGVANLEAMEAAVNYNEFLCGLAEAFVLPGTKVLDFGAGTGWLAARIAARGCDIVCVEPDERLRVIVLAKNLATVPSITAVPSSSVDFVYSFNVLEHIADDAEALGELHRVLVPGGKLLLYVPAFMLLFSAMDRLVGHYRRYNRAALTQAAARAGFIVEDSRYADSLGFAASMALKLAGSQSGVLNARAVRLYDRWVFPLSRLLDRAMSPVLGKNLILKARRPYSRRAPRAV